MTPPTISPEARKCADTIYQQLHNGFAPQHRALVRDLVLEYGQLAINTATEALEKRVKELEETVKECAERIACEERRADGKGHNTSRLLAEAHCKRLSIERDKLAKENAEFREAINNHVHLYQDTRIERDQPQQSNTKLAERVKELEVNEKDYKQGYITHTNELAVLTQKLAMVEKEGIATAQMLLMLTRQAEKVLPHDSEILNAAKHYFVKRFDNPPTQPANESLS